MAKKMKYQKLFDNKNEGLALGPFDCADNSEAEILILGAEEKKDGSLVAKDGETVQVYVGVRKFGDDENMNYVVTDFDVREVVNVLETKNANVDDSLAQTFETKGEDVQIAVRSGSREEALLNKVKEALDIAKEAAKQKNDAKKSARSEAAKEKWIERAYETYFQHERKLREENPMTQEEQNRIDALFNQATNNDPKKKDEIRIEEIEINQNKKKENKKMAEETNVIKFDREWVKTQKELKEQYQKASAEFAKNAAALEEARDEASGTFANVKKEKEERLSNLKDTILEVSRYKEQEDELAKYDDKIEETKASYAEKEEKEGFSARLKKERDKAIADLNNEKSKQQDLCSVMKNAADIAVADLTPARQAQIKAFEDKIAEETELSNQMIAAERANAKYDGNIANLIDLVDREEVAKGNLARVKNNLQNGEYKDEQIDIANNLISTYTQDLNDYSKQIDSLLADVAEYVWKLDAAKYANYSVERDAKVIADRAAALVAEQDREMLDEPKENIKAFSKAFDKASEKLDADKSEAAKKEIAEYVDKELGITEFKDTTTTNNKKKHKHLKVAIGIASAALALSVVACGLGLHSCNMAAETDERVDGLQSEVQGVIDAYDEAEGNYEENLQAVKGEAGEDAAAVVTALQENADYENGVGAIYTLNADGTLSLNSDAIITAIQDNIEFDEGFEPLTPDAGALSYEDYEAIFNEEVVTCVAVALGNQEALDLISTNDFLKYALTEDNGITTSTTDEAGNVSYSYDAPSQAEIAELVADALELDEDQKAQVEADAEATFETTFSGYVEELTKDDLQDIYGGSTQDTSDDDSKQDEDPSTTADQIEALETSETVKAAAEDDTKSTIQNLEILSAEDGSKLYAFTEDGNSVYVYDVNIDTETTAESLAADIDETQATQAWNASVLADKGYITEKQLSKALTANDCTDVYCYTPSGPGLKSVTLISCTNDGDEYSINSIAEATVKTSADYATDRYGASAAGLTESDRVGQTYVSKTYVSTETTYTAEEATEQNSVTATAAKANVTGRSL